MKKLFKYIMYSQNFENCFINCIIKNEIFERPLILLRLSILIFRETNLSHEISLTVDLAVNGFGCQWNPIDSGF